MRWLYHIVRRDDPVVPAAFAKEGFVHASYAANVVASARLHLAGIASTELVVLQIDPRRLDAPIEVVETPRGPMPHVHGPIPTDAIRARLTLDDMARAPDRVTGTKIALVAFEGMTLLDLVGVHDPLSRVRTMGFDPEWTTEIVGLGTETAWSQDGAWLSVARLRPSLDDHDVLVIPGGRGTAALETNAEVLAWLRTFPENRIHASVCTGSVVLAAAGRLANMRATTHASARDRLAGYGAIVSTERVVDEGQRVTAGGVTAGIDLGLHLVRRLAGDEVATKIARQMEWPTAP